MIEDVINDSDLQLGESLIEKERDQSLWASAMSHKRILAHSLAALLAGGVFGYDSVINGASLSMPAFLLYFGEHTATGSLFVPSIWASLWTAMSYLLQAIGGFGIGFVSDRIGRKWACVAASCISIVGVGVQFAATSRGMLLGGKMINGFAIGCIFASATAWASEISPLRLRGPMQSSIVLFMVLMQAIGLITIRVYISNLTPHAFRMVFALQWIWPAAAGLAFLVMPESPNFLVQRGKIDAAKKALQRLYGSQNHINARLAVIRKQVDQERLQSEAHGDASYLELFSGTNFKRTFTVIWLFLATGLNGAALLSQNIYFLIIAGLPAIHGFDVGIGGFGLAVVAIVLSWFYMEKFGRRSLWLAGVGGNIVVMAIIGALDYSPAKGSLWAIAILMNVLIAWQILTITSIGWVITAELSSYRLRAKTQSIGVMASAGTTWLFTFTVPYMYNTDAGNLGARTGFVFMGSSVLLLIGSWFLVPDLKGFTTEEVDWLYKQKISVRHFQQYADGRAKEGAAMSAEDTTGK
ncbi:general substrate transporter [Didymella exigua CBS 183.55]|uniref:General substrate transporter n=1 Tax=Didymella exigua CBS 183.55 TaxID=1150837 RepID=A0A6A5RKH3_9PLEO|nr:general substrate transporter [Didymella exigua CBS 183.55]KAF1926886.1 general substrate transporter [Didymella exigua CBS 183.55]